MLNNLKNVIEKRDFFSCFVPRTSNFSIMKLWDKGTPVNKAIEDFTVGKDRELDIFLAPHDIIGSMAHVTMLESVGLIKKKELPILLAALKKLHKKSIAGDFKIDKGVEDVHSQVEFLLTQELGDLGKKIHSGRSRNDQVLLDLKLFTRFANINDRILIVWHKANGECSPILNERLSFIRSCAPTKGDSDCELDFLWVAIVLERGELSLWHLDLEIIKN